MNPPYKKGKYSMTAELDEDNEMRGPPGSAKPKEGWKQCDYVSNRTRLRCQNVQRVEQIKEYGFCTEHLGYIERLRKEGLRSKHIFDPGFDISESYMQLISCDDDEALEAHHSADFPFVYESMYCDSRQDDDDNPLRSAKIYTKKEVLREYIKSLERWRTSLREQRTIYREKHLRVLQQIARLKDQPDQTPLDPIKDAEKIAHLRVMRREAMKPNMELVLRKKFARMGQKASVDACTEQSNKWLKQLDEPVDEDERAVEMVMNDLVDLVSTMRGKRGRPSHGTALNVRNMHTLSRRNYLEPDRTPSLPQPIVDILKMLRQNVDERRQEEQEEAERKQAEKLIAIQQQQKQQLQHRYQAQQKGATAASLYAARDRPCTSSSMAAHHPIKQQPPYRHILDGYHHEPSPSMVVKATLGATTSRRADSQISYYVPPPSASVDPHGYLPSNSLGSFLRPSTSLTPIKTVLLSGSSVAMVNNGNGGGETIIRPICIDEHINSELLMKLDHPNLDNIVDRRASASARKRKSSIDAAEDMNNSTNNMVCARVNRPLEWNPATRAKQPQQNQAEQPPMLNHNNNNHHHQNMKDHQYQQQQPTATGGQAKMTMLPKLSVPAASGSGSYQQYLKQRHIQLQQPTIHRHQQVILTRSQIYGSHQPVYNASTAYNNNANIPPAHTTRQSAQKQSPVATRGGYSGRGRPKKNGGR